MIKRLTFCLTLSIAGFFLLADPFQRNLEPFNQLSVKQGTKVTLIKGNEYKAKLNILRGDPEDVLSEVKNGQLTLRIRLNVRYKYVEVNVALTYINLDLINVLSIGVVEESDQLKCETLGIDVSSLGFVTMNSKFNSFETGISSAGHVELRGRVGDQVLDLSSGAYYKGFRIISQRTLVDASSGGSVEFQGCPVSLKKRLRSSGSVS